MKTFKVILVMLVAASMTLMVGCDNGNVGASNGNNRGQEELGLWEDSLDDGEINNPENLQANTSNETVVITENLRGLTYEAAAEIVESHGYSCVKAYIWYVPSEHVSNDRTNEIMRDKGITDRDELFGLVYGWSVRSGRECINHLGNVGQGSSMMFPTAEAAKNYDVSLIIYGTQNQWLGREY